MFLCSLHCVSYKCSSASEVHAYIYKNFLMRAQPLVHRLLHLVVGPESLASHRLFERSKDMKVTGARSGKYSGCGRHSKDRLGLLQQLNGQYGTEHCHVGAKHLYSEVHIIWTCLQVAGDFLGHLHTLHWSQGFPWACSDPKLSLVCHKRKSA